MMGAAAADFDNDGFPDLFVAGVGRNILYRNLGNGTFRDVTADARVSSPHPKYGPMWGIHGAWLDFDGDGWLDLFIVNYCVWNPASEPYCGEEGPGLRTYCHPRHYAPLPNQLFRNNRDGTFRDVSIDSGIASHLGKGMGAAVGDVDEDGWPDVFVANDTEPNFLFRNRGDGTFEESLQRGVGCHHSARPLGDGAYLRDFDNDGPRCRTTCERCLLLFRHRTHLRECVQSVGITRPLFVRGWASVADTQRRWKDLSRELPRPDTSNGSPDGRTDRAMPCAQSRRRHFEACR